MKKKSVSELWDDIFQDYDILNKIDVDGFFNITANEIKPYKEPRLMTKFDHSKNRPKIFKDHNLGILPVDNGYYVIGEFDLYQSLPTINDKIKSMILPDFFESIDPENIYSESNALNVALISGMIADVIGEDLYETITGRMRTNSFDFFVDSSKIQKEISVLRPQIEIDGGYEGKNNVVIIEAKNSEPDDFIIRQLYYPYRFWKMKVNKTVVPVFFTYKNGVYSFFVYQFLTDNNYNSIKLLEKHSYIIEYKNKKSIILNDIEIVEEDLDIPFPQADTFNRVKEITRLIDDGIDTAVLISEFYEFTSRQGSYYLAAAKYIGLVEKQKDGHYKLTEFGRKILEVDFKDKNQLLANNILMHRPFSLAMKYFLENDGKYPNNEVIKEYLSISNVNIQLESDSVFYRRASTVRGWIQWIANSSVAVQIR